MDMHPAGVPRLVGPAGGSDFSHFDFSSQFRVLPSNISSDVAPSNLDSLAVRSQMQPLQLHAGSGSSPRFSGGQPLRLREEHPKSSGSPHASTSAHHLLAPDASPLLTMPNSPPGKRLSHSFSSPPRLALEEMEDPGFLPAVVAETEVQVLAD